VKGRAAEEGLIEDHLDDITVPRPVLGGGGGFACRQSHSEGARGRGRVDGAVDDTPVERDFWRGGATVRSGTVEEGGGARAVGAKGDLCDADDCAAEAEWHRAGGTVGYASMDKIGKDHEIELRMHRPMTCSSIQLRRPE